MRHLIAALLVLATGARALAGQATPDSVSLWTIQIGQGTSGDRAIALGKLSELPPVALPPNTQQAIIAELLRLNVELLDHAPWSDDGAGDYYMSLVGAVASLETPDAYRALIPSVGVSSGVARRVARLGDEAVPALLDLINRSYEHDAALGTLGLVLRWADSTGAPLTSASRSLILQSFLQAYADTTYRLQLGLLMGLRSAADTSLLPLARALQAKALARGDVFIVNSLKPVITKLATHHLQLSFAGSGMMTGQTLLPLLPSFTLNVQYADTTLTGQFELHGSTLVQNTTATAFEYLIVKGAVASFRGTGVQADGTPVGLFVSGLAGGSPDKMRIKVWNLASGAVLYDTNPGVPEASTPTTAIRNGTLTIH